MKYNISITVSAAEKQYITRDIADAIEGKMCELLELPHDCNSLDPKTFKLVEAEAERLYEPYLKKLLKSIADNMDVAGDSIDLVWDLAPIERVADKLASRLDVRTRADAAVEDRDMNHLQRMADSLGYSLVRNED